MGQTLGVVSYSQLGQISSEELDDKSPKGVLKLQSYMFLNDNNFSKDDINVVKSYIENYYSFMNFLEYKNPIYLSVAVLCLTKEARHTREKKPLFEPVFTTEPSVDVDEFRYESDEGGEDRDEDDLGYSDIDSDDEVVEFGDEW